MLQFGFGHSFSVWNAGSNFFVISSSCSSAVNKQSYYLNAVTKAKERAVPFVVCKFKSVTI